MKKIGLIGGMSWESSAEYYRLINEQVKENLGGLHSAECILYSVDFEEIEHDQQTGNWDRAGERLGQAALSLEKASADVIVICTNTMHKVIQSIEEKISIPVLHIADATANALKEAQIQTVGLLGTKYTMEQTFYKSRIEQQGIQVVVPTEDRRSKINEIIFDELCLGKMETDSRVYFQETIKQLKEQGAEGVILGCTEIGLLIKPEDSALAVFDTTVIHAKEAVNWSLKK
ncbi:aspartate/glutamate racemase family protein [Marinilactibacillus kalidii]|uniref:aspartate/glutamate racemase family protein n=1 Tax=Marinilactibacillus kalidii TaxID=2820274 RepID=UPI001ABDF435|nr:amino acid racemase [Marinilactibacillus kalidii]